MVQLHHDNKLKNHRLLLLPAWNVDECQALEPSAVTPHLAESKMWSFEQGGVIPYVIASAAVD